MLKFCKDHKTEVIVFAIALVARIAFFCLVFHTNGGNFINAIHGQDGYFDSATNLLHGNGFSINPTPPFFPYSYGTPGYPFFMYLLLFLTNSYAFAIAVQTLLSALTPVLAMAIARELVPGARRIPIIVGVILALAPYQLLFASIFYTEAFFTFVFSLFLLVFFKFLKGPTTRLALASGALLGLATLTRPTVEYLPIVVIVGTLWHFRASYKTILPKLGYFLLVFLLVLTPWLYRNYHVFGTAALSSARPYNLYSDLLPSVLAINNHTSYETEVKNTFIRLDGSFADMDAVQDKAVKGILAHPVALAKLAAISSITFFTHDGMLTFLQSLGIQPTSFLGKPVLLMLVHEPLVLARTVSTQIATPMGFVLLMRLFWTVVTALFLFGIWRMWRGGQLTPQAQFAIVTVFYFTLTTMVNGLAVNARFRMPVESIILAVACVGLSAVVSYIKARAERVPR